MISVIADVVMVRIGNSSKYLVTLHMMANTNRCPFFDVGSSPIISMEMLDMGRPFLSVGCKEFFGMFFDPFISPHVGQALTQLAMSSYMPSQ